MKMKKDETDKLIQEENKKYIIKLENDINSKKEEFNKILKEIDDKNNTLKNIVNEIENQEKTKNKHEKVINELKQALINYQEDLIKKKEQYKIFNNQLNNETDINIKYKEEKNKNIQLKENNKKLEEQLQIYGAKIKDMEKNAEMIEILKDEINRLELLIDKLQTKINTNKENRKSVQIFQQQEYNYLQAIQQLENRNSLLEDNLKKEKKNKNEEIKNELIALKRVLSGTEIIKNDQKLNIMKSVLEEKYVKLLEEKKNNIFKKLSEKMNEKLKSLEANYDELYKKSFHQLMNKVNNVPNNSNSEVLPQLPIIRTSVDTNNVHDYLYGNDNEDNNLEEKIYSYECMNLDKLVSNIKEETDETEIKIKLKNNGNISWNEDSKLKMVEPSDIKIDDIILKQQNPDEVNDYAIIFKNLKKYEAKEYKTCLEFYSGGKTYGDKIIIKINILNETEFEEQGKNQ